jgi:DNA-binding transcriptional ArsR family regulator
MRAGAVTGTGRGAGAGAVTHADARVDVGGVEQVDRILAALADPTRRLVLEVLGGRRECSATTIARETPVSRQAVVKHLAVLDEAGLVAGQRVGREVLFQVRPEGLLVAASWMTELAAAWDHRLRRLKEAAEAEAQDSGPGDR